MIIRARPAAVALIRLSEPRRLDGECGLARPPWKGWNHGTMTLSFKPWFIGCASLLLGVGGAALPGATLVPLAKPELWATAEFRLLDGPQAKNPFDPEEVALDVTFTAPAGTPIVVPAFWFQDYTRALVAGKEVLTPTGAPEWRVRYTATTPGEYRAIVAAHRAGAPGTEQLAELRFTVAGGDLAPNRVAGWVKISPDHRTFETTDGKILRLSGENVCWPHERGTFDYDDWFDALKRTGQNVARLWLCPWWAPLEHVPGTLNHYRLDAGWEIDHVFRAAEARGIYLVLCFDHHGMYQTDSRNWGGSNNFWKTNPYNLANGGPCAEPNDFFTNASARNLYEKRLRYLIGRYGSSPYLLAWEFFNEIDNVYGTLQEDDVVAWHRDVGRWLHAHDPFRHLVSTSLTGGSDRPKMWELPELDFAMYHSYADVAPARLLANLTRADLQRYGKPMWIGEFGTSARAWEIAGDPYLRGFRQGLWGGALGGSVGTATPWWWEDIDASNAYPLWANLNEVLRRAGVFPASAAQGAAWHPADFVDPGTLPTKLGVVFGDTTEKGKLLTVDVPLGGTYRTGGPNAAAIVDPLTAARAAEQLNHYLRPAGTNPLAKPMRLTAAFGEGAKLTVHVNSVAKYAELVVRVDGREIGRTPLPDKDGQARPAKEYDADFNYDLPSGPHEVELENVGQDWVFLDYLQLQRIHWATLAGDWKYEPEPIGLRTADRAVVYVVSPSTVWPAGALTASPPWRTGSVTIRNWPAGDFRVEWYSPETGRLVATTVAKHQDAGLVLPLPDFDDDLAGIVTPGR